MAEDILRAQALFQEVFDRTKNRRIPWEPTGNGEYLAAFAGKFTLLLRPGSGFWPALILRNWENREVFEVLPNVEGVKLEELQGLYREVDAQVAGKTAREVDDALAALRRL
jgi:hypothetical protein